MTYEIDIAAGLINIRLTASDGVANTKIHIAKENGSVVLKNDAGEMFVKQ